MDPIRDGQWILSDTDQAVFFRDLQEGAVYRYPLSWMSEDGLQPVSNPEGVALSADGTLTVISNKHLGSDYTQNIDTKLSE